MSESKNKAPIVLFIDDSEEFVKRVLQDLSSRKISGVMPFGEKYQLKSEIVQAHEAKDRANEIENRYIGENVCAVFVDLVLREDSDHNDESGAEVAERLSEKWPTVPIIMYTRYGQPKHKTLAEASVRFDGALDGHMFPSGKSGAPLLQAGDVDYLIQVAAAKKEEMMWNVADNIVRRYDALRVVVDLRPGKDQALSNFERDVVRLLAGLHFQALGIKHVLLDSLTPGFSGAYVFRAEVDLEHGKGKTLVLKVDEDPSKLEREIEGYRRIETEGKLKRERYAHYLPGKSMTTISKNWWGAISMEYEEDRAPFVEAFASMDEENVEEFFGELFGASGLPCIYNLLEKKREEVIRSVVGPDVFKKANYRLTELARYLPAAKSYCGNVEESVEKLREFINPANLAEWKQQRIRISESGLIHGDLNCRNILVRPDNWKDWVVIDFPNVGQGALSQDFAKAEIEMLAIVMDWHNGSDSDFGRLPLWSNLIESLASKYDVEGVSLEDPELRKSLTAIRCIRKLFSDATGNAEDLERDYYAHLIAHALRALNFRDLTVAKRLLLMMYATRLIEWLEP